MFGQFYNQLSEHIFSGSTAERVFAVCYIDLDRFFQVQNTYGDEVSKLVLDTIYGRLEKILGPNDFLAGSRSDQYFLCTAFDNLEVYLTKLCEYISTPIKVSDHLISVTASIGVHLLTPENKSPDHILRNAIEACIAVKHEGGNNLNIFDDEATLLRRKKREDIDKILRGLENHQFQIYLQPKYDLKNVVVIGFEALIRWIDPQRGIISPGQFLDTIADTEAQRLIDEFVLEEAFRILKRLEKINRTLSLSINVSPTQLMSPWFVAQIESYYERYPMLMGNLRLEILESDTFKNLDLFRSHLESLKRFGVTLSLDDFGTGFASLTHLLSLPIDEVKIDRSFVSGIETNEINQMIVKHVADLAKKLKITTVVEGVENEQELDTVRKIGIHAAQGYFLARPYPNTKLEMWWFEQLKRRTIS